jgi:hypothetical protein
MSLHLLTDQGEDPGVVVCLPCGLDFDAFTRPGEAGYFAAAHNRLHHRGNPVAFVTTLNEPAGTVSLAGLSVGMPGSGKSAATYWLPLLGGEAA